MVTNSNRIESKLIYKPPVDFALVQLVKEDA